MGLQRMTDTESYLKRAEIGSRKSDHAAQAQQQLDRIKRSKSRKREEEHLFRIWLTASREYSSASTERDWQILIWRIARGKN